MGTSRREQYASRFAALKALREPFESMWWQIGDNFGPYSYVRDIHRRNEGMRRDVQILNGRPVRASQALAAVLMAGITSPARDWFGLRTPDPDLDDVESVRSWLDDTHRRISVMFQTSGFYRALAGGTWPDLCRFGTHAMFAEETGSDSMRFDPMAVGEYYLDIDENGRVDTCYRPRWWTVRQIVKKFGLERVSTKVKTAWDRGDYNVCFDIMHCVHPNEEYEVGRVGPRGMRYSSVWYEVGEERPDWFLRDSGYRSFPVLGPRWDVLPGNVYGFGPGWYALGDALELQADEATSIELKDKLKRPPLVVEGDTTRVGLNPGAMSRVAAGARVGIKAIFDVNPNALREAREDRREMEQRIAEAFHSNIWSMFLDDRGGERPTAAEVEARRQEGGLQMGPLLERANDDLLEPGVDRVFEFMLAHDMLAPIPPELEGIDVKAKFISIMHVAQQTTGLVGIQTLLGEVQRIAAFDQQIVDKVDLDIVVEEIGRMTGVRPGIVRAADKVEKIRQAQAQRQQATEAGQAMLGATQGAKNLSGVDPQQISELAGSLTSPAAAAQVGAA